MQHAAGTHWYTSITNKFLKQRLIWNYLRLPSSVRSPSHVVRSVNYNVYVNYSSEQSVQFTMNLISTPKDMNIKVH